MINTLKRSALFISVQLKQTLSLKVLIVPALFTLWLCPTLASPQTVSLHSNENKGDIVIEHPYARATPPNAPTSAVFLSLINPTDKERVITSASTPAAGKVELHTHVKQGDMMKMRQIDQILIPAKSKVVLQPGGLHIMLFDLQKEFAEGSEILVTIQFNNGEEQTFTAAIKKVMSGMKSAH